MSKRTEQVASVLERSIQQVLARGLSDPRITGLITVTRVRVSADLKEAKIAVAISGSKNPELTMHGLRAAAKHIRHKVSDAVALRIVPRFDFHADEQLRAEAEVLEALAKVRQEQELRGDTPPTPTPPNPPTSETDPAETTEPADPAPTEREGDDRL